MILSKRGFFLILLVLVINFSIHLKLLVSFYFLVNFTHGLIWAIITVKRSKIDFIAIILCGIIHDLFEGNYSMITSIIYLSLIGIRFFKHSFLLTKGITISILYYGISLFVMLIFRDLFLSLLQNQTFYFLQSVKLSAAGVIMFIILYLFLVIKIDEKSTRKK